jgi:CRP-like cAMP-binding protein
MSEGPSCRKNYILASLRPDEYSRVYPWLQPVRLERGQVLIEADRKLAYVYFPITAVVSLVRLTDDGSAAEIAWTGREGVVGVPLLLGRDHLDSRAVTQTEGTALRIGAGDIRAEFARGGTLQALVLNYAVTLMAEMAQIAACNRHHRLDQRLSRWLLHNLDRCEGAELHTTQEEIAGLLGVRREGVTLAVRKLQALGLVRCSRGCIEVLDRAGLERHACECYRILKSEYGLCDRPVAQAALSEAGGK